MLKSEVHFSRPNCSQNGAYPILICSANTSNFNIDLSRLWRHGDYYEKKTTFNFSFAAYTALTVLFVVFGVYMLVAEHNEVHTVRSESSYETVTDILLKEIKDPTAPKGVRKQYSFTLDNINVGDASLIFYTVHQLAEVQIDGETVYSLTSGNNGIGVSPSSNWTAIPLYPSDSGQQITVTITPVYKSVINRDVEFAVGSKKSLRGIIFIWAVFL